ncbi:MAG: molybdopterin-guanine dinucleotide biosynthesis protein MobB [Planctomycetes bacterium]|nr:molybdopterin-guanine dinucleotide biosynthesis protein MobB [Planctomycetota bacterium]
MQRMHGICRKNGGKTTLIFERVTAYAQLRYRVGTIKLAHHQHELDTPGKDSHRHRTEALPVQRLRYRR